MSFKALTPVTPFGSVVAPNSLRAGDILPAVAFATISVASARLICDAAAILAISLRSLIACLAGTPLRISF